MVLGLEFPPVSHLVNWQEIWFKGTPFAFSKVTLIYVLAVILTFGFFFLAGRKKRARARRACRTSRSRRSTSSARA